MLQCVNITNVSNMPPSLATLFLACYTLMMGAVCFSKTSVFIYHARVKVPAAALIKVHVFWDVMLWELLDTDDRGTVPLHIGSYLPVKMALTSYKNWIFINSADQTTNPVIIIIFTCQLLPDTSNIFWTMSLLQCFLSWTLYMKNLSALISVETVHCSCTAALMTCKEWHMKCQAPHQRRWVFNISDHDLCSMIAGNYIFYPSFKHLWPGLSGLLWCAALYINSSSFSYTYTANLPPPEYN